MIYSKLDNALGICFLVKRNLQCENFDCVFCSFGFFGEIVFSVANMVAENNRKESASKEKRRK